MPPAVTMACLLGMSALGMRTGYEPLMGNRSAVLVIITVMLILPDDDPERRRRSARAVVAAARGAQQKRPGRYAPRNRQMFAKAR
jgi:hypothetical protein